MLESLEDRLVLDLAGLPALHSLPGSPTAVYLDFNGGTYGTSTYLPYDEDGDMTSFNATEQANITEAWRHVSMYFAMFDTDVTTIRPTVPFAWEMVSNSISGGYSAVGVFPNSQPRSFNQSSDARTRQTGLAHEVGHNFGNSHQSDFDLLGVETADYSSGYDALHGPLMGVDYARSVHKWFIGHTSSPSALQDDMAVITNRIDNYQPAGGDGYRADDYGGTIATATPLTVSGSLQKRVGIIERLNDADAFSFTTTGGAVRIEAWPDRPSPIDLKMEVYSSGTLLASTDTSTNEQLLTMPLPSGTYHVILYSHGDYGDVGQYILNVSTLPTNWSTQDIGGVGRIGYGSQDSADGTFSVGGSGADIFGTADEFRFAHITLTSDGSITARVTANEATNAWSKAGVMIRNSLAANSANAFMTFGGGNGTASFQSRTTAGGSTTSLTGPSGITAPYWLRMVRSGSTFTGYRSADGVNWTQQSSATITMGTTVFIGLAVTSHNDTTVNDAAFDNVTLTGNVGPAAPTYNSLPAPTELMLSLGTGTGINLSWDAVLGSIGYAVDRSSDGANWTQIATPASGVTTYSNTGLSGWLRYYYRVSARDASGRSVPSDVASILNRPSAPFNVTVTSWQNDRLILNWRDVGGDTGYRIERSTDGVNFSAIGNVGRNVISYTNIGINRYFTYSYRIVATSTLGDSPASTVAANSIGLQVTNQASNEIALQWNAVTGAASYRVERSTDGVTFTALATVTGATTYSDTTVTPLGEYYYRVAGQNSSNHGLSPWVYRFAATPGPSLQAPWLTQDIGAVGGNGAAGFNGSTFTAIGSGADIFDTADAFRFIHQTLSGNGQITARVASLENTDPWAKVGVMIRETLTPSSRHALMAITPGNGAAFQNRASTGGTSASVNTTGPAAPYWVRLVRNGSTLTGYRSTDGVNWVQQGTATVAMSSTTYIGLAVSSHDNSELNTATFDNVNVTLLSTPLQVTSFTGTAAGFVVQFNHAIDASVVNLYSTAASPLDPADVTLTGATTGNVRGSLVINSASNAITFLRTGGALPADTYTIRLWSAADGFRLTTGELLDGNADGTSGDDYVTNFTIASSSALIVSAPEFLRGPGQAVNVPATATGIPLRLSTGTGVTSVRLTLSYDPALLTITSAAVGAGTPAGATVMINTSTPGTAVLTFNSPTALGAGPIDFVTLGATVPDTAPYTSKHVLDLSAIQINDGAIAAVDDDGLHIAGYFGDTTGNAGYSSTDAIQALRVILGLASGFAAYQLADPLLLADVTGNGVLNSTDAARLLQQALGIAQPQIPALPGVIPPIVPGGPDPFLNLPTDFVGRPGDVIKVPVNLDLSDGLDSLDLALVYDTDRLEIVSADQQFPEPL